MQTYSELLRLLDILPPELYSYTIKCLDEHKDIIEGILQKGYEAEELFFRDFLSWPRSEIDSSETTVLVDALASVLYELVPVIRFANTKVINLDEDIAETSALVIEFHTRGMAF